VNGLSRRGTPRAVALLAALAVLGAGACGSSAPPQAAKIKTFSVPGLPDEILGLKVQPEDPAKTVGKAGDTYVNAVALYSLRKGDLVQATLQVDELNDKARVDSEGFRASLINGIAHTNAQEVRVGSSTVYLSNGLRQRVATWFKGRNLYVLSTRQEYAEPRTIIRKILELQP
jgi:hypothetical protein